jgi:hypothetical protein
MKVIYIAGPIRAANAWAVEQNIRQAEELSLEVWKMGAACICVHTSCRFFHGVTADEVWLEGDLEIISRCDAILMTDDWQESVGATKEHTFALEHDIPVLYDISEVDNFINS